MNLTTIVEQLDQHRLIRNSFLKFNTQEGIIQHSLEVVREKLNAQIVSIFLFSKDGFLKRVEIAGKGSDGRPISKFWYDETYSVGEGFTGRAAVANQGNYGSTQVIVIPASQDDQSQNSKLDSVTTQKFSQYSQKLGKPVTCAIAVPLDGQNRTYGVLEVIKAGNEAEDNLVSRFTEQDIDWLSRLATYIPTGISYERKRKQIRILAKSGQALVSASDSPFSPDDKRARLKASLTKVLEQLVSPETAFKACIVRIAEPPDGLKVVTWFGVPGVKWDKRQNDNRAFEGSFSSAVFSSGKYVKKLITSDNINEFENREWIEENEFKSFGCFPLISTKETVGTLSVFSSYDYDFYESSIDFIEVITSQMASYIYKIRLEEMEYNLQRELNSDDESFGVSASELPRQRQQVINALKDPAWDFRTIAGIARDTGISQAQVERILEDSRDEVRMALVPDRSGQALFTARSRNIKFREYFAFLRTLITKSFY